MATATYTGFGTKITLGGKQLICTGLNINFGQKMLNSSGSFGGGLVVQNVIETQGMPRMDVPQITVGLTFQATEGIVDQLITMMKNRKTKKTIAISNVNASITLTQCYWNKISFQVAQNQLMTCSVDFNVLQEYSTIYAFQLAAKQSNSTNANDFGEHSTSKIIPYYATGITVNNSYINVIAWSLDVSQMVQLKTFCKLSSRLSVPKAIAPLASHIKFGMMNVNLNVTKLINTTASTVGGYINYEANIISSTNNIIVKATSSKTIMTLNFIQLISANPVLSDAGAHMAYQLNYQANKVTLGS